MSSLTIVQQSTPSRSINNYYEWFRYSMGELQVRLTDLGIAAVRRATEITIMSSMNCAEDIVHLALLVDAIDGVCVDAASAAIDREYPRLTLVLPYLPYGRADREFKSGDCFGLSVFARMLEAMNFDEIKTLDAHSKVASDLRFVSVPPSEFIQLAALDFTAATLGNDKHLVMLFPDKGAAARYDLDSFPGVKITSLYCDKQRDSSSGKFLGFHVPEPSSFPPDVPVLIVDDLCDAGGTFLGIAEALQHHGLSKLGLYVTHGIFSKDLDQLSAAFSKIYCTNSIKLSVDHTGGLVQVFDCTNALLRK